MLCFSTFHTNTTALPAELTYLILKFLSADDPLLPMGGGLRMRRAYHPMASVSRDLRAIFPNFPYSPRLRSREAAQVRILIGETLKFDDLRTLAAFFDKGPGRITALLRQIRYVSISYLDDHTFQNGWQRTTEFAFEAFELLYTSWHLMQVTLLQLYLTSSSALSSIDDPGIWSLLKIRGLDRLTISGPHRCIAPQVRAALKARTRKKKLFPWRPLGMENPGPQDWTDSVKCTKNQVFWQQQYEWLDTRYKYLQDRETITARRTIQRASYRKRQKRWPMLSKRRRSRQQVVVK